MNEISTVDELVNLGITVKSLKSRNGIYALHVASNSISGDAAERGGAKLLEKAVVAASSTDHALTPLIRYDRDAVNGIAGVIREQKITVLILGLHHKKSLTESFLGSTSESILGRCNVTTFIYKPVQPLATIRRTIVIIPEMAENESGFVLWMASLIAIIKNTGSKLVIHGSLQTILSLKKGYSESIAPVEYKMFKEWDEFLLLSKEIRNDDNLIIVMSRKNNLSYHSKMARISSYLNRYFQKNSFILIYPVQSGIPEEAFESTPLQPFQKSLVNFDKILKRVYKTVRQKRGHQ